MTTINNTKYHAIPQVRDGTTQPTQMDAIPLAQMGEHCAAWLARYEHQGYFSNCRQERIPLSEITFVIVPEGTTIYETTQRIARNVNPTGRAGSSQWAICR